MFISGRDFDILKFYLCFVEFQNLETDASPEENTYIVSAQSPVQQQLISKHKTNEPLLVEGPYPVFLRTCRQQYFLLRAETDVKALMKDNQHHLDDENDNSMFYIYASIVKFLNSQAMLPFFHCAH